MGNGSSPTYCFHLQAHFQTHVRFNPTICKAASNGGKRIRFSFCNGILHEATSYYIGDVVLCETETN